VEYDHFGSLMTDIVTGRYGSSRRTPGTVTDLRGTRAAPETIDAACRVRLELWDGRWYRRQIVTRVIGEDVLDSVSTIIGLCESDTGGYVALPNMSTPRLAPDEQHIQARRRRRRQ
jgi:hypothetical protein